MLLSALSLSTQIYSLYVSLSFSLFNCFYQLSLPLHTFITPISLLNFIRYFALIVLINKSLLTFIVSLFLFRGLSLSTFISALGLDVLCSSLSLCITRAYVLLSMNLPSRFHFIFPSPTFSFIIIFFYRSFNFILLYQNVCTSKETSHYRGPLNGTIHLVAGGGGASLADFAAVQTSWSLARDYDFGFLTLTSVNRTTLRVDYTRSRDGQIRDSFTISQDYRDILSCDYPDSCSRTTLAS